MTDSTSPSLNSLGRFADARAEAARKAQAILDAVPTPSGLFFSVEPFRSAPPKRLTPGPDGKVTRTPVAAPRTFAPRSCIVEVVGWSNYGDPGSAVEVRVWTPSDNDRLQLLEEHRAYVKVSALRDLTSEQLTAARSRMAGPVTSGIDWLK